MDGKEESGREKKKHPFTPAQTIQRSRARRLCKTIKNTNKQSIKQASKQTNKALHPMQSNQLLKHLHHHYNKYRPQQQLTQPLFMFVVHLE